MYNVQDPYPCHSNFHNTRVSYSLFQERILHRIRDATGQENAEEILRGMSEEDVVRWARMCSLVCVYVC